MATQPTIEIAWNADGTCTAGDYNVTLGTKFNPKPMTIEYSRRYSRGEKETWYTWHLPDDDKEIKIQSQFLKKKQEKKTGKEVTGVAESLANVGSLPLPAFATTAPASSTKMPERYKYTRAVACTCDSWKFCYFAKWQEQGSDQDAVSMLTKAEIKEHLSTKNPGKEYKSKATKQDLLAACNTEKCPIDKEKAEEILARRALKTKCKHMDAVDKKILEERKAATAAK